MKKEKKAEQIRTDEEIKRITEKSIKVNAVTVFVI